jgi:hypothetical protein
LGIHRLLEEEKNKAKVEATRRIKQCIVRLHGTVDAMPMQDASAPIAALTGLQQELEFIEKISTWPWRPETLRALATALVLPVLLWFITRLLDRFIVF